VKTALHPAVIGNSVKTVIPKLWNCGSTPKNVKLGSMLIHSLHWRIFAVIFPCVSITPLGLPLVPEV
jgi:hypothetical protein